MVEKFKKSIKMKKNKTKQNKKIKERKQNKTKKLKKLDDLKNQNLRVIFEDIVSHKREVKEIEELTFKQLQNLRKRLNNVIRKKVPVSSFSYEGDEESKEEE